MGNQTPLEYYNAIITIWKSSSRKARVFLVITVIFLPILGIILGIVIDNGLWKIYQNAYGELLIEKDKIGKESTLISDQLIQANTHIFELQAYQTITPSITNKPTSNPPTVTIPLSITPSIIPTANQILLFKNLFNDNSKNWRTSNVYPIAFDINSGKLHINLNCLSTEFPSYCADWLSIPNSESLENMPFLKVNNFDIKFDYSIISNNSITKIGINYRVINGWYELFIDNTGVIELQLSTHNNDTNKNDIKDVAIPFSSSPKPYIIQSNGYNTQLQSVNTIELIVYNQFHKLLINGVEEFCATDGSIQKDGNINIFTSILDGGIGESTIDNMFVWKSNEFTCPEK